MAALRTLMNALWQESLGFVTRQPTSAKSPTVRGALKALVDGSPSCTGNSLLIHSKHEADNAVAGAADVSHHARQTPSQEAAPHTGRRSPPPLMRKWPALKSIQQTNIRGQIKSGVAPSFPIPCPAPGFCLVREPTPFELAQKPSDFLRS